MHRIVFSNYDDLKNPNYGGGGAVAVHEVAKRLAKEFDVIVLTGKYRGCLDEAIDSVKYERIGTAAFGPKIGQLVFILLLPFYAWRKRYDLWVESLTPPFSVSFLPLITSRPVIGLVHTLAGEDMSRKYKLPFYLVERLGLKFYKNFIVMHEFWEDKIRKFNPTGKITIIPNGINEPLNLKRAARREFISFIGRIEINQKGLDTLLGAYKEIHRQVPYRLLIAGSGSKSEERKLSRLIARLGLKDRVVVAGRVGERQKIEIYRKTVFFAVVSRFETFGLAILEALAFGLPVVVSDIEGYNWIPRDAAIKVRTGNVRALADAMLYLAGDRGLRQRLGSGGKRLARRYDWDVAAEKYKLFFRSVIASSRPAEAQAPNSHYVTPVYRNQDPGFGSEADKKDQSPLIEHIIERKLPCYFISPHLDDAALSAGGLLASLSNKTSLTVVTIFTKGGPKPYSLSAKRSLRLQNQTDSAEAFAQRRAEDERVCGELGAKAIHLGFTDALWRKKDKQGPVASWAGKIMPEFGHLYPTFRWHVLSGKIKEQDLRLRANLVKVLGSVVPANQERVVFGPAGFGGHVDHILTSEVCKAVFPDTIFWKDFPYPEQSRDKAAYTGYKTLVWPKGGRKKQALVLGFKSQIYNMFPQGVIPEFPEIFFVPDKWQKELVGAEQKSAASAENISSN